MKYEHNLAQVFIFGDSNKNFNCVSSIIINDISSLLVI
jgi:hypothetical protein